MRNRPWKAWQRLFLPVEEAPGNSGVILSQLFRGFTKEIKKADVITTTVFANAFVRATETAYKAVMKPKEGTILTVAKGMSDKAVELVSQTEDLVELFSQVIEHGDYVLSQTPEDASCIKTGRSSGSAYRA